jgi:hypothetical protein
MHQHTQERQSQGPTYSHTLSAAALIRVNSYVAEESKDEKKPLTFCTFEEHCMCSGNILVVIRCYNIKNKNNE